MKKNAEKAAALVQQALNEVGGDFALSNARGYLMAAFNELNRTHNKRVKRDLNFKRMEEQEKQKRMLRVEDARWRLKQLDDMFKLEEANLLKIKQQNGSNQS